MVRYVGTVRYPSIFDKKYGSLVRYAFFVMVRAMVRARYLCTLFELKILDISDIAPDFCIPRQRTTAEADAKCVN